MDGLEQEIWAIVMQRGIYTLPEEARKAFTFEMERKFHRNNWRRFTKGAYQKEWLVLL